MAQIATAADYEQKRLMATKAMHHKVIKLLTFGLVLLTFKLEAFWRDENTDACLVWSWFLLLNAGGCYQVSQKNLSSADFFLVPYKLSATCL